MKNLSSEPGLDNQIPFLQRFARRILERCGDDLSDVYVILPGRRSALYLRHYLMNEIDDSLLAPEILSFDDFIKRISPLRIADNVSLLFRLYENFKFYDHEDEHDLERFAPLGSVILKDFNLIDQNFVDGSKLFEYLEEVKAIERWAETLGEPIEAEEGSNMHAYYLFWANLANTYYRFRNDLLADNCAYPGLAYRRTAENIIELVDKEDIKFLFFGGFNLLSRTEEEMMHTLAKIGRAEVMFDTDIYYVGNKMSEAGHYFREFRKKHPVKPLGFVGDYLGKDPKEIEVISVSNKITQAKLAGDLLNRSLAEMKEAGDFEAFKDDINRIAILLPDESLLLPVLHSLPTGNDSEEDSPDDLKNFVNITMGLSMDKTPFFNLIDNLFRMQENFRMDPYGNLCIYYKDLIKMLRHPYIQYSTESKNYERIQSHIAKVQTDNEIYIPLKKLQNKNKYPEFYSALFRNWDRKVPTAFEALHALTHILAGFFAEKHNVLEREYLYTFYTLLSRLENELAEYAEKMTLRTFRMFLYEIMRNESVPYTGEPLAPVQIMGMLESRALDFEHVIILSCNETVLPKGKVHNSIIPFDIRTEFGMPTHLHNDAVFAYTFYRLFHRAKRITLIYSENSGKSDGKSIEPSRFIAQIESELAILPNIRYNRMQLKLDLPDSGIRELEIAKEPVLMDIVAERLASGFSPSVMNMYIRNPLNFFERRVLKLNEAEEIEEHMLANTFGTMVHKFLEDRLEEFIGKTPTKEELERITADPKAVIDLVEQLIKSEKGGIVLDSGKNFILTRVATHLLDIFLKNQAENEAFHMVAKEMKLRAEIPLRLPTGRELKITIRGEADRIDVSAGVLRIVDYKTGKYNVQNLRADSVHELLNKPEKEKIVQLLIYKYLIIKNLSNPEIIKNLPAGFNTEKCLARHKELIKAGFYFFRQIKEGFIMYTLKDEPDDYREFLTYTENFIGRLVTDMFDTDKPFRRTPSEFAMEISENTDS